MTATLPRWLKWLTVVVGVIFVASGVAHLGLTLFADLFQTYGLPYWFLLLVGSFLTLGGALLLVPGTAPVGGLIIGTIMVGAVWTHLAHLEFVQAVGPVLYLLACLTIIWRRKDETLALLGYRRAS